MNLLKKLLLAGVFSVVLAVGVAGAGTASAHDDEDHHSHCWIEATNSIDPDCWKMVMWGGPSRGWVPIAPFLFNYNDYYLLNHFPYYNLCSPYYFCQNYLGQPGYLGYPYMQYNFGYPLYNQSYQVQQNYWWLLP